MGLCSGIGTLCLSYSRYEGSSKNHVLEHNSICLDGTLN